MSRPLPALRGRLDLMPSPLPERPGLLVRDPLQFTSATLIVPPPLVPLLAFFDGRHNELELKAELVRRGGPIEAAALAGHLSATLRENGFLDDDVFAALRDARQDAFARAPTRAAAHAGSAYPAEPEALSGTLDAWLAGRPGNEAGAVEAAVAVSGAVPDDHAAGAGDRPAGRLLAVAAPHVSPEGGLGCYAAAYGQLAPELAGRTFVVLGTSHYGEPDRFGLTRKPFTTPLGETACDAELTEFLAAAAGPAAAMVEDYCHAVEHSIEFQVVFLQRLFGAGVRVLPVLCGPLAAGLAGRPEDHAGVARALAALRELQRRAGARLFWVLGVDLAHVGRRYGDAFAARAAHGPLRGVAGRDLDRLALAAAGDADGFWDDVREGGEDALRWCGSAPIYTFLRAVGGRGEVLRYEQWNIDAASVVSFAAVAWRAAPGGTGVS